MSQEPAGNSKVLTESQDLRQTAKQTSSAKDLFGSGYSFSVNSDQTLKNTMAAKVLLRRQ